MGRARVSGMRGHTHEGLHDPRPRVWRWRLLERQGGDGDDGDGEAAGRAGRSKGIRADVFVRVTSSTIGTI
jgi:hypothetical protein